VRYANGKKIVAMNRARFVGTVALGAAATTVAPRYGGAQTPAPLITVHVGAPPSQDVGPILYALHAGLFAKGGLAIDLQQMNNGASVSAAVAGGALQIGFSSLQGVISGHARGIPFSMIAPGAVYVPDDPYAYMFVRKDAPFKTGADLNGKVLGSPALKDLDWIANAEWMDKNGGDFKSAKSIELPNPSLLPALVDGRVDAYTVGDGRTRFGQRAHHRKIVRVDRAALSHDRLVFDERLHRPSPRRGRSVQPRAARRVRVC
jgi:ABC-type nitrate/sulfonate/bicarbonate transport system substrate-binding protein